MAHILLKKISDKSICTENYGYASKTDLKTVTFCSNAPAGPSHGNLEDVVEIGDRAVAADQ